MLSCLAWVFLYRLSLGGFNQLACFQVQLWVFLFLELVLTQVLYFNPLNMSWFSCCDSILGTGFGSAGVYLGSGCMLPCSAWMLLFIVAILWIGLYLTYILNLNLNVYLAIFMTQIVLTA